MLDIKFIRENQKVVEDTLHKRQIKGVDISKILKFDDDRRKLILEVDKLRHERNRAAVQRDVTKGKKIKELLHKKEKSLNVLEKELEEKLLELPNIILEGVPTGDETANEVLKKVGSLPKFDFVPKDHVELGEVLDIIDIPRAAKVSGTRFGYLKNEAVLLEFALIQFAFDILIKDGFIPLVTPVLIKKEITEGLGYWQGGGNENFYLVSDYEIGGAQDGKPLPLYLIGTSEHVVVPMHSGEIFAEGNLPKRYVAFSSCFRREAGSYGRDTRGILRVHQFDKVEMVTFTKPEDDKSEREKLLSLAENFVRSLELPFQLVKLASGDLAFPCAETVDIETWIPSQNKYRETHSISTTTDFQARRLNIKYDKGGVKEFVHILNGTAFAIGRTLIAILENKQLKDGSVVVPKALRRYTNFSKISPK